MCKPPCLWYIVMAALAKCYEPNACIHQNSYVEAVISIARVFGNRAFGRSLGLDEIMMMGPWVGISVLIKKSHQRAYSLSFYLSALWGHSKKVAISKAGRNSFTRTQWCLAPWSWTSQTQICEKINICFLSHPVYGILL